MTFLCCQAYKKKICTTIDKNLKSLIDDDKQHDMYTLCYVTGEANESTKDNLEVGIIKQRRLRMPDGE